MALYPPPGLGFKMRSIAPCQSERSKHLRQKEQQQKKHHLCLVTGHAGVPANIVSWDSGGPKPLHSKVVNEACISEGTHGLLDHMIIT